MIEGDSATDFWWFDALGKPVPQACTLRGLSYLQSEDFDLAQAALVLWVVCREIEHDQPGRALTYLRSFIGSSETVVIRCLAEMFGQWPEDYMEIQLKDIAGRLNG